jgi:hypothetical protein
VVPRLKGKKDNAPERKPAPWRKEGLGEEASGRGDRRSVSQQIRSIIPHPHLPEKRWSAEDVSEPCIRKFQFAQLKFIFGLPLGPLALGDLLAEVARMLAVESFHDRFTEWCLLGVGNDHPCPCYCLQEGPVQAD